MLRPFHHRTPLPLVPGCAASPPKKHTYCGLGNLNAVVVTQSDTVLTLYGHRYGHRLVLPLVPFLPLLSFALVHKIAQGRF